MAFEYDILFIVSAGNYKDEIQFNISRQAFEDLDSGQLESTTLRNIVENNYSRKIIAPSESINALTIGACHSDSTTPNLNNSRKNLVQDSQTISPISRVGFGYKRSIKPDVLMPGGRALYRLHPIGPNATLRLENNSDNTEPGIKCACPGTAGEINKTNFSKGTSISTALATRLGSRLLDILDVLGADDPNLSSSYYTVLVKALIVHGSRWNSSSFEALSQSLTGVHGRYSKRNIFPYLGYGTVNESKILFCTDQRVTILGFGTLKEGQAHEFNFPLPNELSGHMIDKTLTITMAYNSPVNPNTRKYRKAHLYFDNVKNNELIDFDRIIYDFNASSAGTVQHDVLHGNKADAYLDNQYIKVKVNCREDSAKLIEEIKYGLCVTFEIQENVGISIYNGVRDRITQQIRPRV